MLGVALRVAQALSLHSPNPPFPVRPFEREMRNRLWQVIGGLDSLLSLDHGFEPQTRTSWLQNNIPSNVNDSDISFDMEGPVVASEGFTDMTFSLVTQRGSYGWRSLNFSEYMEPQPSTLEMRQKWVDDFKQAAPRMLKDCQPDKFPFHWFTKRTAECISAMMQLIVLRPLQPCPNFTPPRVRGDGILNLAVEGLRTLHDLQTDPRAAPWRISDSSSAIWHAIAVAIAELCVCEDPSLMGRYWPFVEDAYQRFIDMPESHRGAVFAAMEKFMAQGRAHRDKLLGSPGSSGSISGSGINMASNQPFPGPTPPPVVSQSQGPGFSRPHIPTTTSFISTTISQPAFQNPLMAMPDQMAMISPWAAANVWSGMEFTNPGLDSGRDSSWLNYEGFIEDLYSGWR